MKKTIFILALVVFTMFVVTCDDTFETNYPEEGYGKVVVHNEVASSMTVTRITIARMYFNGSSNIYNDVVSLSPGESSNNYELELSTGSTNYYSVTVTLNDNTTKSQKITPYEDIVNNLYYNGAELVERK